MQAAISYNRSRIRRETCASVLEASLPAAYQGILAHELSLGRLVLDQAQARRQIEQSLQRNMSNARMNAQLQDLAITFSTINRREPEFHWLSGKRPDVMPVISAVAEWTFADGWQCRIHDQIELVLD